jgi:FkbM family methyltransferase
MNIIDKAHMLHRFWRYRLRTERESVEFLLDQNLKGKTVIDIGANKGIYTYWMSKKAGEKGKVISFEPQPELEAFLNDVKESFNLTNVSVVNKGLSDTAGKFKMYRKNVGAGGAKFAQQGEVISESEGLREVEVSVTTLDNYLKDKNINNISFIKCDVEGHELSVFKGGEKTLRASMPTLLFECLHKEAVKGELFSFLNDLGYKGFFIQNNKKIDYRDFKDYPYRKPTTEHRNYVFMKNK